MSKECKNCKLSWDVIVHMGKTNSWIGKPCSHEFEDTPQMSDEWWAEGFDKQFGVLDIEKGYSVGRGAGCDDCASNNKLREEHKSFIRKTLAQQLERVKEKIEGLRKEKSRCGCADDDGSCYQQCSASYNEAVDDAIALINKDKENYKEK